MITKTQLLATSPAGDAFEITPDDDNNLPRHARGIYIGGGENLRVQMSSGEIITFVGLATGVVHPISTLRVYNSGTTATNIIGLV